MIPLFTVCVWIIGIFAPELIVFWALEQFDDAQDDVTFMRSNGCPQWSYKLALFARMGGLRTRDGTVIESGKALYELDTSEGKTHIKRFDYVDLSGDIDDKSKANVLAKLLAVLQITRFLCGTIARAAERLPISPLEYITCTYVVCTLLIFAFWFYKPYNVQEPIRVELGITYVLDPEADPAPGSGESKWLSCKFILYFSRRRC